MDGTMLAEWRILKSWRGIKVTLYFGREPDVSPQMQDSIILFRNAAGSVEYVGGREGSRYLCTWWWSMTLVQDEMIVCIAFSGWFRLCATMMTFWVMRLLATETNTSLSWVYENLYPWERWIQPQRESQPMPFRRPENDDIHYQVSNATSRALMNAQWQPEYQIATRLPYSW